MSFNLKTAIKCGNVLSRRHLNRQLKAASICILSKKFSQLSCQLNTINYVNISLLIKQVFTLEIIFGILCRIT